MKLWKKRKNLSNVYLWFDTEFSSLDLNEARLLQIALVMTDSELNRLLPPEDDLTLYIRLERETVLSSWVQENLAELIAQCKGAGAVRVRDADMIIRRYLEQHLGPQREEIMKRPVLAGNSLQCDWILALRDLPSLIAFLHYRILDVSSWKVHWNGRKMGPMFSKSDKAMVKRHFPGVFNAGGSKHDAHYDVLASIAELNFYTQTIREKTANRSG